MRCRPLEEDGSAGRNEPVAGGEGYVRKDVAAIPGYAGVIEIDPERQGNRVRGVPVSNNYEGVMVRGIDEDLLRKAKFSADDLVAGPHTRAAPVVGPPIVNSSP